MRFTLRDEKTWRHHLSFFGALALHAAIVALGYAVGARSAATGQGPLTDIGATEIEIEEPATGGAAGHVEPPISPPPAAREPSVRSPEMSATDRGGSARARSTEATPAPSREGPLDSTGTDEGYSVDPSSQAPHSNGESPGPEVDLGIGAGSWSRYVNPTARAEEPRAAPPRAAPAPTSSTGGLAEALEAHDHEIGIGPAGRVLSAAHEAGHLESAPALGTATFSVTVLRTGAVQVELTGASSQPAEWKKVADEMAAAIKRKPPRISGGRNGVRIGIELVAEEKWPNGQGVTRSEGPHLAVDPPTFRATDKAVEDLRARNPAAVPPPGSPAETPPLQVNVQPPGVYLKGRGKVCSYALGLSMLGPGLTGGCDPSNIGARASRVVSAKVISETML